MSAVRVRRSSRSWPPGASCLPSPRCSRGEAQHLPPASSWRWRGAGAGAGAPGVPGSGGWGTWGGDIVLQKVASELHPKVRNHGEGPY